MNKYLILGIGGVGMRSLAHFMHQAGYQVVGYDRDLQNPAIESLHQLGIFTYDENMPDELIQNADEAIYSTAIEDTNPIFQKLHNLHKPLKHRSEMLFDLVSRYPMKIGVSGTSGKSTITSMIAYILSHLTDCDYYVGADILTENQTQKFGSQFNPNSKMIVIETDESDKSLLKFMFDRALIHNIGTDHYDHDELMEIFQNFANEQKILLLNNDCCHLHDIIHSKKITYSIHNLKSQLLIDNYQLNENSVMFTINEISFQLKHPGYHMIENALAAICMVQSLGYSLSQISSVFQNYPGVKRRFNIYAASNQKRVIDDYAHNPDKIKMAIQTSQINKGSLAVIFQPHGYGPLKKYFRQYLDTFIQSLRSQDQLILLPIYDMGGSADRSVSIDNFKEDLLKNNPNIMVNVIDSMDFLVKDLTLIQPGIQQLLILGARNPHMSHYAQSIAAMW